MPATRIHPRILHIAAPFEGDGVVNCYLIDAPKKAIIDTGAASVPRASLIPALHEIGWQPSSWRCSAASGAWSADSTRVT